MSAGYRSAVSQASFVTPPLRQLRANGIRASPSTIRQGTDNITSKIIHTTCSRLQRLELSSWAWQRLPAFSSLSCFQILASDPLCRRSAWKGGLRPIKDERPHGHNGVQWKEGVVTAREVQSVQGIWRGGVSPCLYRRRSSPPTANSKGASPSPNRVAVSLALLHSPAGIIDGEALSWGAFQWRMVHQEQDISIPCTSALAFFYFPNVNRLLKRPTGPSFRTESIETTH